MAQYKAAMKRLFREEDSVSQPVPVQKTAGAMNSTYTRSELELWIDSHYGFIMRFLVPLLWCLLFVIYMDRKSFLEYLYIPFIGIFAAVLANAVPIGGGIVYVPVFSLLGINLHLGVSFSVATMSFGNGIFGFLKWMHKDPSLLIWESFAYTVIPSSIGSFLAILFFPPVEITVVRTIFAVFCLLLAGLVLLAVYRGGAIDKIITTTAPVICSPTPTHINTIQTQASVADEEGLITTTDYVTTNNNAEDIATTEEIPSRMQIQQEFQTRQNQIVSSYSWFIIAIISFLAGGFLVPSIGVGPALTTFLSLQLVGYTPKRAIVTGIITGGWVSVVPFLLHLCYLQDVPLQLWVMVLPGVYFGAQVSTIVSMVLITLLFLLLYDNIVL